MKFVNYGRKEFYNIGSQVGSSEANRLRREKLERKTSSNATPRSAPADVSDVPAVSAVVAPAVYDCPVAKGPSVGNGEATRVGPLGDDESGTIPLRKKAKPPPAEDTTASLSRLVPTL